MKLISGFILATGIILSIASWGIYKGTAISYSTCMVLSGVFMTKFLNEVKVSTTVWKWSMVYTFCPIVNLMGAFGILTLLTTFLLMDRQTVEILWQKYVEIFAEATSTTIIKRNRAA